MRYGAGDVWGGVRELGVRDPIAPICGAQPEHSRGTRCQKSPGKLRVGWEKWGAGVGEEGGLGV